MSSNRSSSQSSRELSSLPSDLSSDPFSSLSSSQWGTQSSSSTTANGGASEFAMVVRSLEYSVISSNTFQELKGLYGSDNIASLRKVIPKGCELYDQMIDSRQSTKSRWRAGMTPEISGYEEVMYVHENYNTVEQMLKLDSLLKLMDFRAGFTLGSPKNAAKLAEGRAYKKAKSRLPSGPNILVGHEIDFEDIEMDAIWHQIINEKDGLLIAWGNWSPIASLKKKNLPLDLAPDLVHWSDMAFLQWSMCTSENAQLRYVLQHHVINNTVFHINNTINEANGGKMFHESNPAWPGATYSTETSEGMALLGTPNGSGVAYMLIQHRQALGHKKVDNITIFDYKGDMMMLFHIVDVERAVSNATVSNRSQSDSNNAVTMLPRKGKQTNKTLRKRCLHPHPDAEYEDESDEDEDYETDSDEDDAPQEKVEEPPTDDEDEAMAEEEYAYESDEDDNDQEALEA